MGGLLLLARHAKRNHRHHLAAKRATECFCATSLLKTASYLNCDMLCVCEAPGKPCELIYY
jgi:hypothetical protein